jgi:hypothetical protein
MVRALLSSNVLLEHIPNKKKQKSGETYAFLKKIAACECVCVSVCEKPKLIGVSSQ